MVVRLMVADTVTGDKIQTIPTGDMRWEQRILSPESLSASVTLKPGLHQRLDLYSATTPAKSTMIVADGENILAAGPVIDSDFDDDGGSLQMSAAGIWDELKFRPIYPANTTAKNLVLTSGEDEGEPNPAVRTTFTGRSWPYIVRTLVEQSMARPGGALPIVFEGDGTGAHDKSYDASSFKSLGEALEDLTQLQNGPEITFTPRFRNNRLEYVCRVGDDATLNIAGSTVHRFDFTSALRSVRSLKVKRSGAELASTVWGSGGQQESVALYARSHSPRLIDAGFPLREKVLSSNSTVTQLPTLQRYTDAELEASSAPRAFWSWEFHGGRAPLLADVKVGDWCQVWIPAGHPFLPEGRHLRRIVGLSGDGVSPWVSVTTDEVVTW